MSENIGCGGPFKGMGRNSGKFTVNKRRTTSQDKFIYAGRTGVVPTALSVYVPLVCVQSTMARFPMADSIQACSQTTVDILRQSSACLP
ncbi:hypothetical protein BaRGS_00005614 [Batillaria attramentaria]|uniref:Uncharacterized protein n=1 Tax=Batillaria attramentaria TaxID=370345 RepID=A0ABD0LUB4_9CAEN